MTTALQGQRLAVCVPAHPPPCAWACPVPAHRRGSWRLPYTDGLSWELLDSHLGGNARGMGIRSPRPASVATWAIFVHRVGQPSIGGKLSPL
ncbi:hCG1818415 [Homo sapiens]|uniref:C4orf42 protein n=1 Tax=Homo sapiens TaxID=9606 RepID=Q96CW7_HUMAN